MMHPTCTELELWSPSDQDSPIGHHVEGCPRCQWTLMQLRAEANEFKRVAPVERLLARLNTEGLERKASSPSLANKWSNEPPGAPPASTSWPIGRRAILAIASEKLSYETERGQLWVQNGEGKMWLGNATDLRAYLEGAWFESHGVDGVSGLSDEELDKLVQNDLEAEMARLSPRLEALGWMLACSEGAAPSGGLRGLWKAGTAVLRESLWMPLVEWVIRALRRECSHLRGAVRWIPPLALASVALVLWLPDTQSTTIEDQLGEDRVSDRLSLKGAPDELGIKGAAQESVFCVVVQPLVGEQFESCETTTVNTGDLLRLKFRLTKPGPVSAGILADSGEWLPFFEGWHKAGIDTPDATWRVGEGPGGGKVLVGPTQSIKAVRDGESRGDVKALSLVRIQEPHAGGNSNRVER